MRKKEPSLLISFRTAAEAMAMETACREAGVPGRLIPVPSFVTAGCSFGWKAPEAAEREVMEFVRERGLEYEKAGIHLL